MKMPSWPIPLGAKPIDLGLHRVFAALENLGNPHLKLPQVIHIAGTNGKGSTLAFLKAMLNGAGKKCHVYTSPHLVEFNERIVVADAQITDEKLNEILAHIKQSCPDPNLTFFEATTLAAIVAFANTKADYTLLETGLGGRLDATNIIANPALTIITPISFDHMEYLGETLGEIAGEKAAIIKPESPCIISIQQPEALTAIKAAAREKNSPSYTLGEDFSFKINDDKSFVYKDRDFNFILPQPSLPGPHQYINAATAIRAAVELSLSKAAIEVGINKATWPARLQKIEPNIYLDGGHNEDAARIIADFIISENPRNPKKNIAIIGMLKTKDYKNFINKLAPDFDEIIAVPITNEDFRNPADIKAACDEINKKCITSESVGEALAQSRGKNNRVVICGSLYLAGQVLADKNSPPVEN